MRVLGLFLIFGRHNNIVDKSAAHTDVLYLWCFTDIDNTHEFPQEGFYPVHLYARLEEARKLNTRELVRNTCILQLFVYLIVFY